MTYLRLLSYVLGTGLLTVGVVSNVQAGKIQFGVAELPGTIDPHGDSYVVTIDESETALIEHARALINWVSTGGDPPGEAILVTEIAPGADGVNRNYLAAGAPLWSWHAVGTPSFVDQTIEILDGWPTFVEQDVDGWIANTNGFVGFWGYTVTTELGPVVPEPPALRTVCTAAALLPLLGSIARRRQPGGACFPVGPSAKRISERDR